MQKTSPVDTQVYRRKHQRKKAWRNFVRVMACIVVFCTTYALILPAITMEKDTFCALEAHVHEDACYQQTLSVICDPAADTELPILHTHDELCYQNDQLICTLTEQEGHVHTDGCYITEVTPAHTHDDSCMAQTLGDLVCQTEEIAGHTHGETCYDPVPELICGQEEREGHLHTDDCYCYEQSLSCACAEGEGHAHGEDCYEIQSQLSCALPEDENHTHADVCYTQVQVLTCTQPEAEPHTHADACYTQVKTLICTNSEDPGHSHTDECYNQVLTCQEQEQEGHTHTDACYEIISSVVCTLEEHPEPITETTLTCSLTQLAPHTHDSACYDAQGVLSCTISNAIVHQHTQECIQASFTEDDVVCGKKAHEHILACYSDPTADLETAADWEKTVASVKLTGNWRQDVLLIAESQLGYTESSKNYEVTDDEKMMGYSRYGAWYGIPYGDWCAMYASFCLSYAGVEGMPLEASCPNWIQDLSHMNLYHSEELYVPAPADLIFFDWNINGVADHVGLVVEVDGETVKTIEGNCGDCVAYQTYELSDSRIMGYGTLPVQFRDEQEETVSLPCGMAEHAHVESCYDDRDNLICQLSEHTHTDVCNNKQLFYSDDTIRAYVTIKNVEELPQDLSVRVWQINPEENSEDYAAMQAAMIDQLVTDAVYISEDAYYGMELLSEGAVYVLPETAKITVRVEFAKSPFTAKAVDDSTQVETYQLMPAENAISTFVMDDDQEEDETGIVYLTEDVTNENYENTNEGLMALGFQSNAVTNFAVAVTTQTQTGTYWTRVESTEQIDTDDTYIIVSAEGNYALTINSSGQVAATAVTLQTVKGNEEYYTISGSDNNRLHWKITNSGSSYQFRNNGGNKYLRTDRDSLVSDRAQDHTLTYYEAEHCWRIVKGSSALRHTGAEGANFGRTTSSDYDFDSFGVETKQYYTRDMLMFKSTGTISLEIPDDVVETNTGTDTTEPILPPTYDEFIIPSGSMAGETAVQVDDLKVDGKYWSDASTSDLEADFRKDTFEEHLPFDGMVKTDKSVIYGGDDYGVYEHYDPNTFGVTLSALGQEYAIGTVTEQTAPIDVVFVIDVSGSMTTNSTGGDPTRANAVVTAVNASIAEIMAQHGGNRVGIVTYSSGAWELLPLGRYEASDGNYLRCVDTTVTFQPPNYSRTVRFIQGGENLKVEGGRSLANIGSFNANEADPIYQGLGTYTQAGIAKGYNVFQEIGDDVIYETQSGKKYTRRPVIVLLSDGEPTHSTNIYMDVLNGPHYGDGQGTTANALGVHGYNTILSANYYKRMVGIQYGTPAKFYSIGMGISDYAAGDGPMVDTSETGDAYKRAVLNPALMADEKFTATKNNNNNTIVKLQQMLNSTFGDHAFEVGSIWPDVWTGVPHKYTPVLQANPYGGTDQSGKLNYAYADAAYFGNLPSSELQKIFHGILEENMGEAEYGFVLYNNSSVNIKDKIGAGMEVKGTPVLRYAGQNYYNPNKIVNGNVTTYTYSGTYRDANIPGRVMELSDIRVTVTVDSEGIQTVEMYVPDSVLPTYTPEMKEKNFYYEALPVRLIYQVGLTADAQSDVLALLDKGGKLTYYTNAFDETTMEPESETTLIPSLENPFYKETNSNGYKPHSDRKTVNSSNTTDYSVVCSLTTNTPNGNINVYHKLGNNGKLEFSVDTVDIPVEKKWASVNEDDQGPIRVDLYKVKAPTGDSDIYTGTRVEGASIILQENSEYDKDWKGTFEDLPKPAEDWFYAVVETVPDGFAATYENRQIQIFENGDPFAGALVESYDENGVAQLVTLINAPLVVLPATGGPGTTLYTTGGLLLMAAAVLLLLHKQKNKRRKGAEPSF